MNDVEALDHLIQAQEFKDLGVVPKSPGFNLVKMLNQTISENAWSRILAFLFDSTKEHGLGNLAVQKWTSSFKSKFPPALNTLLGFPADIFATSATEWVTRENRRLDILICLSNGSSVSGIIGIENKVWADESEDQVGHYQRELEYAYPDIPKALIFLTPTGRSPASADDQVTACPPITVSYESFSELFEELSRQKSASTDLARLLDSLNTYIREQITKPMEQIRKKVWELYQDEQNRRAMELIAEHLPAVGPICGEIETKVIAGLNKSAPGLKAKWYYYPERSDDTMEIKLICEELDQQTWEKFEFGINFMLRCHKRKPRIGDQYYFYLAAWCERNANRDKVLNLKLPGWCSVPPTRLVSEWEILWVGGNYTLCDLGEKDANGLAKLMLDGVSETYQKIRKKVNTHFPS